MALSPQEKKELARLQVEFDKAGGRGVDVADRIDYLVEKRDRREWVVVLNIASVNDPAEWDWPTLIDEDSDSVRVVGTIPVVG
jgi:hypothetical protein